MELAEVVAHGGVGEPELLHQFDVAQSGSTRGKDQREELDSHGIGEGLQAQGHRQRVIIVEWSRRACSFP